MSAHHRVEIHNEPRQGIPRLRTVLSGRADALSGDAARFLAAGPSDPPRGRVVGSSVNRRFVPARSSRAHFAPSRRTAGRCSTRGRSSCRATARARVFLKTRPRARRRAPETCPGGTPFGVAGDGRGRARDRERYTACADGNDRRRRRISQRARERNAGRAERAAEPMRRTSVIRADCSCPSAGSRLRSARRVPLGPVRGRMLPIVNRGDALAARAGRARPLRSAPSRKAEVDIRPRQMISRTSMAIDRLGIKSRKLGPLRPTPINWIVD